MSANSLGRWLEGRAPRWRDTHGLLERLRGKGPHGIDDARQALQAYRGISRDLSLARRAMPDGRLTRMLEELYGRLFDTVHQRPYNPCRALADLYREEVPKAAYRLRGPLLAVATLFVASGLAGWLLVSTYPELAALFASEAMINGVQQGRLWTDDLFNIVPSSLVSLGIMTNNIVVTLMALVLGALYGLGTLYIIGLNGLMLGGVFALTARYGLADRLLAFVVPHGIVELTIICVAGAAGLQLGRALARPGDWPRVEAFRRASHDTVKLMAVCVPFLIGCGLIEGYISPNDAYSLASRLAIGFGWAVLFWAVLLGRIWRGAGRFASRYASRRPRSRR